MKDYESYDDKWKDLIGAAAGLLRGIAGMVWYIAAALVAMMIIHSVLSEPFTVTCSGHQIPELVKPIKIRATRIKEIPFTPNSSSEGVPVRLVEPKDSSQE